MFPRTLIATILISGLFVASGSSTYAQCVDQQNTKQIEGKVNFYSKTAVGTLAFTPNVHEQYGARNTTKFVVFPSSGTYRLSKSALRDGDNWWFVINHHRSGSSATGYVGLAIVIPIATTPAAALELYRGGDWVRNDDKLDATTTPRQFKNIQQFLKIHAAEKQMEALDTALSNYKWHGTPSDTDVSSWDNREQWALDVNGIVSTLGKSSSYPLVKAKLLRFTESSVPNSNFPLDWVVNTSQSNAIYIRYFSSISADYDKHYCLIFED